MQPQVVVEKYNPEWASRFSELKSVLWPAVQEFALSLEHVGSTSVPGLAAKPIIDLDIVIPDMSLLDRAIEALSRLGYVHRGNLGIQDRESFKHPDPEFKHNLYVCPRESLALRNHLCLRDALRADEALRDQYSKLKFELATKFPDSIDDYIEGKSEFILGILEAHGHGPDSLEQIRKANLAPSSSK